MEEDRISQLPDQILEQILSLIGTNQALQTTILSTRWKTLSHTLSDLRFHLSLFAAHRHTPLKNLKTAQALSHRFSHFVSHLLALRDGAATIRNFHLSFDTHLHIYADQSFIDKCIRYAVNHGVESLRLHARCGPDFALPAAFFTSKTLRELELRQFGRVICALEKFSLPHLKTLFLEGSWFCHDGYYDSPLKEPFSGFPELEKLTLRRCSVYKLVMKAPKLRFLEIVDESSYSNGMEEISGPLLTSFRYEGKFPFHCSKIDLPMLEEVYLSIHYKRQSHNRYNNVDSKRMTLECVRMFQLLGNAKIVALTLDTFKVLEKNRGLIEESPCPFLYMKCLKVMKGRRETTTVLRRVMNYLTEGTLYFDSLVVEFPQGGMTVVEKNSEDLFEDESDDQELELLFGTEDEIV
ncbi:F-box/LRR-repeat protein-like protein [Salvia divinorum]|uniref:F-box/LRR-repeat protein-like protein n=1 Tax=Salvia divinorum TaxID=28513 RepID=A0ABD1FP96_SALDI